MGLSFSVKNNNKNKWCRHFSGMSIISLLCLRQTSRKMCYFLHKIKHKISVLKIENEKKITSVKLQYIFFGISCFFVIVFDQFEAENFVDIFASELLL